MAKRKKISFAAWYLLLTAVGLSLTAWLLEIFPEEHTLPSLAVKVLCLMTGAAWSAWLCLTYHAVHDFFEGRH